MPLRKEGAASTRPTFMDHALNLARAASARSEDPYCKVGACVLSSQGVVVGVGYNGTLPGLTIDWDDRDGRRDLTLHAEANALRHSTPMLVKGGILAVTHFPCAPCTLMAASYGVKTIVWQHAPDWNRYPAQATERVALIAKLRLIQVPA